MYCKKTFVNSDKYKEFHHPEWHTNLFDVEVMKYVCKLKYEQNKGFRELLAKTKGKIIVEDATMQNTNESVLKWGCQDLEKKSLIKKMRKQPKPKQTALRSLAQHKHKRDLMINWIIKSPLWKNPSKSARKPSCQTPTSHSQERIRWGKCSPYYEIPTETLNIIYISHYTYLGIR